MINKAISILQKSKKTVALTGAGISVESGIAPFRGKGGLWEKYDPYIYAHINSFIKNPSKSWIMLKEMGEQIFNATPNPAHYNLTRLQKFGKLDSIITQNVDNLHQDAGNIKIIEFHGNYKTLICLSCGNNIPFGKEILHSIPPPPLCDCGFTFKPNVILFGESPQITAMKQSEREMFSCDVLLVIGTSAMVFPADRLPFIAKNNNATIIEINTEPTQLTSTLTDVFLKGSAADILTTLMEKLL